MMAAILASRLLGLVRNAVISHQLGQKTAADIYAGAFQIPDLLFFLIAGGALSSSFIPVFTEKMTLGKREEAWHLFSSVASVMFVVISAFVILGEVFAIPLTRIVNPGFSQTPGMVETTARLTRIVLPAQLCFFLGGILMGVQYALHKFKIAALGPVIYNAGIIFGGVVLYPFLGLPGMCWGALLGAIVGNFGLQLWAVRREGMQFRVSFDYKHPDVMKVWKLMLPVVLGVALPQVSIWINRAFATNLSKGSVAALTNANQVMQVPLGLFAQAMAVAIFPTLSALAAEKRYAELRSTSSRGIRNLLFLTIPASVFMVILAVPAIQFLYQSGKFTGDDALVAAGAFSVYGLGIFAWSAQSILSRSFYALQDTVTPVVIGTLVTFIFIPLNVLFMNGLHMGIQGLALATTIAAILHMAAMMWVLRNRLRGFEMGPLLLSVGKTTLASAIAGVVCWLSKSAVDHLFHSPNGHVKIHAGLSLVAGFGLGGAVYVGCASALKMDEMRQAVAMLRRKTRKAG